MTYRSENCLRTDLDWSTWTPRPANNSRSCSAALRPPNGYTAHTPPPVMLKVRLMYCYIDLYEYYRRKHDLHSICIAPSAAITSTAVMTPTAATHRCYQQPVVEPPTFLTPSHTHHDRHKPMTWRTRVDRIQLEQPEHVFTGTVADTYFQKQIASGDILKDSS